MPVTKYSAGPKSKSATKSKGRSSQNRQRWHKEKPEQPKVTRGDFKRSMRKEMASGARPRSDFDKIYDF